MSEGCTELALTKGLIHRQIGLHDEHGGAGHLGLLKHMTPLPVQDTVDATNHLFRTLSGKNGYYEQLLGKRAPVRKNRTGPPYLNLHKVDGLHKPGLGRQHTSVEAAPGSGDDLAPAAVDGVRVQGHVVDIEAHTTHILFAQSPLQEPETTINVLRLLQPLLPGQIT